MERASDVREVLQQAVEALQGAIRHIEANTCRHEDTYRGGAIWTICRDCGSKWADDRGGFVPYKEPKELTEAHAAIASLQSALQQQETPEQEAAVRDRNWCWKCASAMVVDVHREVGMRWMQCKHCKTVYALTDGVRRLRHELEVDDAQHVSVQMLRTQYSRIRDEADRRERAAWKTARELLRSADGVQEVDRG